MEKSKLKFIFIAILIMAVTVLSNFAIALKYILLLCSSIIIYFPFYQNCISEFQSTGSIADKKIVLRYLFSSIIEFGIMCFLLHDIL